MARRPTGPPERTDRQYVTEAVDDLVGSGDRVSAPAPRNRAAAARSPAPQRVSREVGLFLRSVRESQMLSQDQVAALSADRSWRLSRSAISAIERGRNLPSLEALIALSRVLHIDPVEVLDRAQLGTDHRPEDLARYSFDELDRDARELFWSGDFRGALTKYDLMRAKLALDPPPRESDRAQRGATIQLRRAAALKRCGNLLAARAASERSIALSGRFPKIQAQAYTVLAALHMQMENVPLARDAADRAVCLAANAGPGVLAMALMKQGRILWESGRYEPARQTFVAAREQAHAAGDDKHRTHIEGNIGMCLLGLGRRKHARRHVTLAVRLARTHGQPALEASWLVELGHIGLDDGNPAFADRCATEALRIARKHEHWFTIFRGEWLSHRIARAVDPADPDRNRIGYLKKLLVRLENYRGEKEYQDCRAALLADRTGVRRES